MHSLFAFFAIFSAATFKLNLSYFNQATFNGVY